jgi:SAM-dependent methyltransferase
VVPGGSILDLGSGPGRMTHALVALGHPMVAVDDSEEMLRHIEGAERVHADVFGLRLGRCFDGVLAASHLINTPGRERRAALLDVCRSHVTDDGVVLLQRYEPGWARSPESGYGTVGPVEIDVEIHAQRGAEFDATVTYILGEQRWAQTFTSSAVEDDQLVAEALAAGLRFDRWLDDRLTWAQLLAE